MRNKIRGKKSSKNVFSKLDQVNGAFNSFMMEFLIT